MKCSAQTIAGSLELCAASGAMTKTLGLDLVSLTQGRASTSLQKEGNTIDFVLQH